MTLPDEARYHNDQRPDGIAVLLEQCPVCKRWCAVPMGVHLQMVHGEEGS